MITRFLAQQKNWLLLSFIIIGGYMPYAANAAYKAIWIYGGVEGGRIGTDVESTLNESSKLGWGFGLNATPSYYHSVFVFDLGTQWNYSKISGSDLKGRKSTVITRHGGLFFSPRYTFLDYQIQVGPRLDFLFGTDVSYSPVENPKEKVLAWMAGVEGVFELPVAQTFNLRAIPRYSFDLNIEDRFVWAVHLGFQIGIPIYAKAEQEEKDFVKVVSEKEVSINIGLELINFAFDSAEIPPKSLEFIKRIADFLVANGKMWSRFEVEGHTDNRGSHDYNMNLSQRRAEAVRAALIKNKLPQSKVSAKGYGFTRPLLTSQVERAYAKNRRVELRFEGVTDAQLLGSGIQSARDEVFGKTTEP